MEKVPLILLISPLFACILVFCFISSLKLLLLPPQEYTVNEMVNMKYQSILNTKKNIDIIHFTTFEL